MAVTIQEIAKRAGVSPGTVSRVLNGLNKENRPSSIRHSERIRRIAREMQYRPNHAARQMLKGQFDAICLLNCRDHGFDWVPVMMSHGIQDALSERNMRLVVEEAKAEHFKDPEYMPSILNQAMVDGVLVHSGAIEPEPVVSFFDGDPLPAVYVNCKFETHAVYPDERNLAYKATKRLIEVGHRNIGFFRPIDEGRPFHFSLEDRLDGFAAAMTEHGLSPHRTTYPQVPYVWEDAMPSAMGFLKEHADLTAALCYDLPLAITLHHAIHLTGRSYPTDFSLVVFSEYGFRYRTGIAITTASIPFYEVGTQAVEMIDRIRNGESSVPSVVIPCKELEDADLILPPKQS